MKDYNIPQLTILQCHDMSLFLLWVFPTLLLLFPSSTFFCLVIVLPLISFKWTLCMHKYKSWEYVMTPQVFTFRLQTKSEASLSSFTWCTSLLTLRQCYIALLTTSSPRLPQTVPNFPIPDYFDSTTFLFHTFLWASSLRSLWHSFGCLSFSSKL